jgi:hypothetical protein
MIILTYVVLNLIYVILIILTYVILSEAKYLELYTF